MERSPMEDLPLFLSSKFTPYSIRKKQNVKGCILRRLDKVTKAIR